MYRAAEPSRGSATPVRHRVLLAEQPEERHERFRTILVGLPGVEVVGLAANGHDVLRMVGELRPDVVLMDVSLPGLDGLEVTRRCERRDRRPRILLLSTTTDGDRARQALVAGADGFLLKSAEGLELELAIVATARGDTWISAPISRTILDGIVRGWRAGSAIDLTPRQREVLHRVAKGRTTREIADEFGLSVKTIESHRAQIMQRLEIHNPAGLVRYAIRTGLVSVEP